MKSSIETNKMNNNYICNSNKYRLGGQTNGTIALDVAISDLPEHIEVEGNTLLRKTSFHVSLVCIDRIVKRHSISIPDFIEKVISDFCVFINDNDISLTQYRDEFRFVQKEELKSVVVMCDVSNLGKFFNLLNEKYQLSLECQPTHVSLFTLQLDKAIFLIDSPDLENITKIISRPSGVLV